MLEHDTDTNRKNKGVALNCLALHAGRTLGEMTSILANIFNTSPENLEEIMETGQKLAGNGFEQEVALGVKIYYNGSR